MLGSVLQAGECLLFIMVYSVCLPIVFLCYAVRSVLQACDMWLFVVG